MTTPLVLAYHSVGQAPAPHVVPSMSRTVSELEADVARLRSEGRRIVTAGELPADGEAVEPLAALTFDDGWADALTVAAPALAALGVRGTFFVCPGLFGNRDATMSHAGRVLTAGEARALHATGMELGAHSLTHPDLTELSDVALRAELEGSKEAVEAITGEPWRGGGSPRTPLP